MFPVRCYTCNTLIGHKYSEWVKRVSTEESKRDILDSFDFKLMCCRRMFLTHVHTITDIIQYSNNDQEMDDSGTIMYLKPENSRCVTCD